MSDREVEPKTNHRPVTQPTSDHNAILEIHQVVVSTKEILAEVLDELGGIRASGRRTEKRVDGLESRIAHLESKDRNTLQDLRAEVDKLRGQVRAIGRHLDHRSAQ